MDFHWWEIPLAIVVAGALADYVLIFSRKGRVWGPRGDSSVDDKRAD